MADAVSTTLLTFRLDSPCRARSIDLLGSWDNFTHSYRLDRDQRRGAEHWTGCFRFKDIICDGFQPAPLAKREGGLMMGGTYWYYYKLDDCLEYHDPTKPSTTACPLLPGQNLNVIQVPSEMPSTDHDPDAPECPVLMPAFTLDPHTRFTTPRPNKFEAICRKPLPALPGPPDLQPQVTRDSWKSAHSPVSPLVANSERPFSSRSGHSISESLRSWKAFRFLRKARSAGNPITSIWRPDLSSAKRPASADCDVKSPVKPPSDSGNGLHALLTRKGNSRLRPPLSPLSSLSLMQDVHLDDPVEEMGSVRPIECGRRKETVQRSSTLHHGNRSRDGHSDGFMHHQSPLQQGSDDNGAGTCSEPNLLSPSNDQTASVDATRLAQPFGSVDAQLLVRSDCAQRDDAPILALSLSALEPFADDLPTNAITGLPHQGATATTDAAIMKVPAEIAASSAEGEMHAMELTQGHASSETKVSRAPFTEPSGPLLFRSALASIREAMSSLDLAADESDQSSGPAHHIATKDPDKDLVKSSTFSSLASDLSWGDCLRDFSGRTSPSFSAYSFNPADVSDDEQAYTPLDTPNNLLSRHSSSEDQSLLSPSETPGRRFSDLHGFHYSLPDDHNSSQATLTKTTTASTTAIVRPSTPPAAAHRISFMNSELSNMQQLMDEFGYLGEVIA